MLYPPCLPPANPLRVADADALISPRPVVFHTRYHRDISGNHLQLGMLTVPAVFSRNLPPTYLCQPGRLVHSLPHSVVKSIANLLTPIIPISSKYPPSTFVPLPLPPLALSMFYIVVFRLPLYSLSPPSSMFAALAHVKAQPSTDSLSRELEITMNGVVAAHCPTHMLAIYSSQSPTLKRRITLFPIHDLVLVVHCAHLPRLPATVSNVTGATVKLPVVPMCLPSPETFNILQAYLYTKRLDMLFSSLIPPPPSFDNPNTTMPEIISRLTHHLSATCSKVQLAERAMIINGLWRNVCALGVQDDKLWNAIGVTWEAVAGAIRSL